MTILDARTLMDRAPEYHARLNAMATEALWAHDPWVIKGPPVAHVWRYKYILPLMMESKIHYTMGEAEEDRRALNYLNPKGGGSSPTCLAGIQVIFPGEFADCHRHSASACRFVVGGDGGFTVQDGQRYTMGAGDLILTPSWIWHDHGNDGKEPTVWMDYTDMMFISWGGLFREDSDEIQQVTWPHKLPESNMRFAASGMLPVGSQSPTVNSPQLLYPWAQAEAAVRSLLQVGQDPYDCAMVEYINPVTGGHCTATQAHYMQLLVKGFHGKARRRTGYSHCHIVRGSGYTIIAGQRFDWESGDTLMIPNWTWYEHVAHDETFIHHTNDSPIREPFGLHREEVLTENGGHQ
ncbi:cupin domain-containing protein [Sphingomonadaceae bacterium G21617-S1]|nr:cupin domain-containing protein [Sphingomonadaceae bacterium G21617-S1]